jgi:hypothetical protein
LGHAARAAVNQMVQRDVLLERMQIRNAAIDDFAEDVADAESETRVIVRADGPRDIGALQEHMRTVVNARDYVLAVRDSLETAQGAVNATTTLVARYQELADGLVTQMDSLGTTSFLGKHASLTALMNAAHAEMQPVLQGVVPNIDWEGIRARIMTLVEKAKALIKVVRTQKDMS